MSNLAITCVIMGAFIIIYRAPFAIAPKKTIRLYESVFSTNTRMRIFGLMGLSLAAFLVGISHASENSYAVYIFIYGLVLGLVTLLMIIFTSGFRNWAYNIMDLISMSTVTARTLSLIVVVIGALLVYLGVAVF